MVEVSNNDIDFLYLKNQLTVPQTRKKHGQQVVFWEMCKWRIREWLAAKVHKVEEGLGSSKWME